MSKLQDGLIPKGSECPFKVRCPIAQGGQCRHLGEKHTCDFSCASARGYDLCERYAKKLPPII